MKKFLLSPLILTCLALSACNQPPTKVTPPTPQNPPVTTTIEKPPQTANTPSKPECTWSTLDASQIGLKVKVSECGNVKTVFKIEGNKIYEYDNDKKVEPAVIEVFSKPKNEKPEDTLKNQFISKLNKEDQANCAIKLNTTISTDPDKLIYTITPSPEYLKKNEQQPETLATVSICSQYGPTHRGQYFEFHKSFPEQFIFVRVGQSVPLFDEKNIEFVAKP